MRGVLNRVPCAMPVAGHFLHITVSVNNLQKHPSTNSSVRHKTAQLAGQACALYAGRLGLGLPEFWEINGRYPGEF
jgi:hypothetical protein